MAVVVAIAFAMPTAASADAAMAKKYLVYANGLYKQRQYDKAIQYYSGALKQDRRLSAAWKGLGNCYYAKRDKANALKYYKYALQTNPNDTALASFVSRLESGGGAAANPLARANALYKQRNYDGAIAAYNQVIASNPNDAKAYQGLGNAHYAKGDKANAVTAYKRALQLNPGNQALANFLAQYAPESDSGMASADGPKDWVQPLWRSAILPGWGQFYNDQPVKGTILGVATLGFWAAEITSFMIGSGAADEYRSLGNDGTAVTQDQFDSAYNTWETMASINHISFIGHSVLYTFTLIDAIWSAKRKPSAQAFGPVEKPRLEMALGDQGAKLKYDLMRF